MRAASRDSPNDALRDLDAFHWDEFLELIQTGHVLYLTAELGTETRGHTHTHIKTGTSDSEVKASGSVSEKIVSVLFIFQKGNFSGLTLLRWAN